MCKPPKKIFFVTNEAATGNYCVSGFGMLFAGQRRGDAIMNLKFKRAVSLASLAVIAFSSCAKTPESVTSSSEKSLTSVYDLTSQTDCKTASLEEMSKNVDEYVSTLGELELDNMTFSKYLEIDIPDYVPAGKYICPDNFQDNYAKIFSYYDEDYDEANAVDDGTTYPTGPTYINEEKNLEMAIGCTGFFYYMLTDVGSDVSVDETDDVVKIFTGSEFKTSDETYEMLDSGEEVSVSEAYKIAQDFADEFVQAASYTNEIDVCRITLYQCEQGYFYLADYTESVNGVNILEYESNYLSDLENLTLGWVNAQIFSDEMCNFTTQMYFEEQEITGEIDGAIELIEATKYLSEALASKMSLQVQRIALAYCMYKTQDGDNSEFGIIGGSGTIYEPQLCWVFYFDETLGDEVYAMLNCEDLSITYVDNTES